MGCQLGKCALTIPTYFIHRKITHVSFPRLLFAHFQVAYFGIKNLATSHLHTKSEGHSDPIMYTRGVRGEAGTPRTRNSILRFQNTI